MNDYNKYTNEINKIFNILDNLEKNWNNEDSKNYIENIQQYKSSIINFANVINNQNTKQANGELE
ncbi:MAG: hypothetical protein J6B89_00860 [Bacilli bacterium]|nr:hypothetical protein [Bacilli bacterium]